METSFEEFLARVTQEMKMKELSSNASFDDYWDEDLDDEPALFSILPESSTLQKAENLSDRRQKQMESILCVLLTELGTPDEALSLYALKLIGLSPKEIEEFRSHFLAAIYGSEFD